MVALAPPHQGKISLFLLNLVCHSCGEESNLCYNKNHKNVVLVGFYVVLLYCTNATSIIGASLIMIACVYLLHVISAVIIFALQLQFRVVVP